MKRFELETTDNKTISELTKYAERVSSVRFKLKCFECCREKRLRHHFSEQHDQLVCCEGSLLRVMNDGSHRIYEGPLGRFLGLGTYQAITIFDISLFLNRTMLSLAVPSFPTAAVSEVVD